MSTIELTGLALFDIYRGIDKAQLKARKFLLTGQDAREGHSIMERLRGKAEAITFYAYGGYGLKKSFFPCYVTRLRLSSFIGPSSRLLCENIKVDRFAAIKTDSGIGPRYVVSLYRPDKDFKNPFGYGAMKRDETQRGEYWLIEFKITA